MTDMSKTFDTVSRSEVINHLNPMRHLLKIQIKDVELSVRIDNEMRKAFRTNIGTPQGKGL